MSAVVSPLISIGPRVRKSPFFNATIRYGARAFTVYNHTYMPTSYTDPVTEYWSLVNEVTLWDVACERQIEISGPDAARFVQMLTPRDTSKCEVEQCQYVLITDEDGGIVNDAVMLRVEEQRFWLSPGDGDALLWVLGAAVNSGMDVKVNEPDVSPLQLQGPKAPHVARDLFGEAALKIQYYWMKQTMLDEIPVVLARTGWSGELGYEIFLCDGSFGDELWGRVMEAGKPYDIAPIAPSHIRSIEGCLLSYVSDISRADNAFVLGVDFLVDLDQPDDFIGKNALRRIRREGVKRCLVGMEIHGDPLEASNTEFWHVKSGDRIIGHVTRCVYSPRLKKNIGFVNVPIEHADVGTSVALLTPWGEKQASVCETPWFLPQKKIPDPLD
ncbi:MAG: glycine cleavage T C-terminal barrel domain-containing protein [Woeseia sp.]